MNTLISILLTILNNIRTDNTTGEIVRQILLSYQDFENMKASDLAQKSFCNTSTVNRFCKSLGFSSFNDMKAFMVSSRSVRRSQLEHHMEITDAEAILNSISNYNQDFSIERFKDECGRINEMIASAPRTVVIGAVFPKALTFHYQEDMLEMGKCVYNAPLSRKLEVPNEDPEAVIILITFTGRLINYCRSEYTELCSRFRKVILITGNEEIVPESEEGLILHLPFAGDDEASNAVFVEIMRYLKYRYYMEYRK